MILRRLRISENSGSMAVIKLEKIFLIYLLCCLINGSMSIRSGRDSINFRVSGFQPLNLNNDFREQ